MRIGGLSLFLVLRVLRLLVCAWPGLTADAWSASAALDRGPYLQLGSPDGIVVRWRTDVATSSRVAFGPAPGALSSSVDDVVLTTEHIVALAGLEPDTRYYYSVGTTTETLAGDDADHFFVTAPMPGSRRPIRIWALGDSGTGNADAAAVRDAYDTLTGSAHTDLWLMLGDNAYDNGTDAEYQTKLFDIYPEMLRKSVLWPTLGNHDAITADSQTQSGPYYDIFTLPTAGEAGGEPSGTEAYYSFDYGNVHFVVLDSEDSFRLYPGGMTLWLESDLAQTTQDWIVAFWHHPPYSKGSHDSDSEMPLIEMRENAIPLLDDFGADLTLTGHSHSYERSYLLEGHYGDSTTLVDSGPASMIVDGGDGREDGQGFYHKLDLDGAPHDGMVHNVAGSSGKITGGELNHPVMFTSMNVLGSLVLEVDSNRLDVKFLGSAGQIQDYYTLVKGPVPTVPAADFDASPRNGQGPLVVQFTDLAANLPTSWEWDFESDGTVDSEMQNPSHMYMEPGFYAVRQVASNSVGSDETVRIDYVCVTAGIPTGVHELSMDPDKVTIFWQDYPGADTYDAIKGDVGALRAAGGDVGAALIECLDEDVQNARTTDPDTPPPGAAFFYLVRATNCARQQGTYDTAGIGQTGSRDEPLLGLANICSCDLINDVDGDAICDAEDFCPLDGDNDIDADALCAEVDNCPGVANPDQDDGDGDGVGDPCDPCPFDLDNDIDTDEVCGDVDNCPSLNNGGQEDLDGDGAGNVCDPCPADAANDEDADTHCGDVDNCPVVANLGQEDGDGDGIGDICDTCAADPENDVDSDNLCGDVDNCASVFNSIQVDTDQDGFGDVCDNCPAKSNEFQEDNDGDGAGNVCDCRPNNANRRVPGAVTDVIAITGGSGNLILGWREATGSDTYAVTRGSGPLHTGDYGHCLESGLTSPGFTDTDDPAVGQVFFYQIQGASNQCGPGELGYTSSEVPRVNTNPAACPAP